MNSVNPILQGNVSVNNLEMYEALNKSYIKFATTELNIASSVGTIANIASNSVTITKDTQIGGTLTLTGSVNLGLGGDLFNFYSTSLTALLADKINFSDLGSRYGILKKIADSSRYLEDSVNNIVTATYLTHLYNMKTYNLEIYPGKDITLNGSSLITKLSTIDNNKFKIQHK